MSRGTGPRDIETKVRQVSSQKFFGAGYWASFLKDRAEAAGVAVIKIAVILVAYWVVRYVAFKLIDRLVRIPLAVVEDEAARQARESRVCTLQSVVKSAAAFILGFVALIMILQAVGYNAMPILATASVAGIAIGFGAQKLIRDVISGFFILMENQYAVGDYITVGAVTGLVEELGMRTTKVRDAAGKLYIISNGDITQVCNHSRGAVRMTVDVPVPAAADLDRARQTLDRVGEQIARDLPDRVTSPFVCEGLASVGGAAVSLRMVGEVAAVSQNEVQLELNTRVRRAFAEDGLPLA